MKYDQQKLHRTALELSVKEILESFNLFKGRYQPHSSFRFGSGLYPSKNSVIHSWGKSRGIIRHNSSLQCYSVLSDILVKNELCIPLERG